MMIKVIIKIIFIDPVCIVHKCIQKIIDGNI